MALCAHTRSKSWRRRKEILVSQHANWPSATGYSAPTDDHPSTDSGSADHPVCWLRFTSTTKCSISFVCSIYKRYVGRVVPRNPFNAQPINRRNGSDSLQFPCKAPRWNDLHSSRRFMSSSSSSQKEQRQCKSCGGIKY